MSNVRDAGTKQGAWIKYIIDNEWPVCVSRQWSAIAWGSWVTTSTKISKP